MISGENHNIIAHYIGSDWKRLARYLEIEDCLIEAVDEEYRQLYEKAYQIIRRWGQRQGNELDSTNRIIQALRDIQRNDIVNFLRR
nr:FAS-associated death domain protein [Hydra vulgaris]